MWAKSAIDAGATSIVCSPFEAAMIRQISDSITIITPGVRVEGDDVGDQARVMTPKMAITNGADYVVIGRSITSQWNESATAMQSKISTILESINN
jgi:orotidine-5'-phosphate decarboxylase